MDDFISFLTFTGLCLASVPKQKLGMGIRQTINQHEKIVRD